MKYMAKHVVYMCEKLQVVRINIGLMVSKVVKVSHFQKRSPYDFAWRRKKRAKNPAKMEKSMKNRVTLNCHGSLNIDARIFLKVSE